MQLNEVSKSNITLGNGVNEISLIKRKINV